MTANWTRLSGSESTLAPTSRRREGMPRTVGRMVARAGRSTPDNMPRTILAVAMAAPGLAEDGAQDVFGAHEMDPDVVLTRSKDGPANLWLGGLIGTHCVNNDVNRHQEKIAGF